MSVIDGRPLSNTAGSVLDPIVSLRRRVRLRPGESAHLVFSTLVTSSREAAVALADKYRDPATFERTVTLAWTQAQVQLHHLGIDPSEAHLFQDLAGRILYSDPTLRPSADTLKPQHIGGRRALALRDLRRPPDRPGPDRRARGSRHRPPAPPRARVLAHEGAGRRPRHPEREGRTPTSQDLQTSLETLVRTSQSALRPERTGAQGNVFILRRDLLSDADARCPPGGGPGRAPEPPRHPGRAARARPPGPVESPSASAPAGASGASRPTPRRAAPSSSSSTASAASSTTAAST